MLLERVLGGLTCTFINAFSNKTEPIYYSYQKQKETLLYYPYYALK